MQQSTLYLVLFEASLIYTTCNVISCIILREELISGTFDFLSLSFFFVLGFTNCGSKCSVFYGVFCCMMNLTFVLMSCLLDAVRFAYFSRASLDYLVKVGKYPDVLHTHNWETAIIGPLFWDIFANQVEM